MLSNAKHNYTLANHLGLLSGPLFKDQKKKTVLSQSVKDKLQKKSDYQWLFNTTQLIDLDKDRMFMIVPKEETLDSEARPIGKALPRTLYPLPVPQKLTGDAKLAYEIMHPGQPLPNYDQLLEKYPHLATYSDDDHPVFSEKTDAMQEGQPGAAEWFARLDAEFAAGNTFGVDNNEDELLLRALRPEAPGVARKRGQKRSAAEIST